MTTYEEARARIEAVVGGKQQWKVYAHAAPATFADDLRALIAGPPEPSESDWCVVTYDNGTIIAIPRAALATVGVGHEHIKWTSDLTKDAALKRALLSAAPKP